MGVGQEQRRQSRISTISRTPPKKANWPSSILPAGGFAAKRRWHSQFFRELYAGIGPTLGDKFKKALPKIGARLLKAGSVVSAGADLAGATAGVGTLASGAMSWVADIIKADDTVEKLQDELTKALAEQNKRFLIVIDDIDRLAPDEALLIFRLVKSVGRLPNVLYLLVFDRELAEAIVSERYPSEGPHYLEKIIQAGFDVPQPRQTDLNNELLRQIELICGSPPADAIVRFMNIFYDVIAPEITTPRDLIRITNALSVTWPAVGNEVDCADFVGLEVIRLFQPSVYRNLRSSKDQLCGTGDRHDRSGHDRAGEMNALFLDAVPEKDRERVKRSLMRLFPRLQSVWSNLNYGEGSATIWDRDRLACSKDHFDLYFRFSIGDDVLSRAELDELVSKASDEDFVKASMRAALGVTRRDGSTKAKLILDELKCTCHQSEEKDVGPFLKALFAIADELDVEFDKERGFSFGDNELRIYWLLRSLTRDRFDLPARSKLFVAACKTASLTWFVYFAVSAYTDYYPREGRQPESEANCLTTKPDADAAKSRVLAGGVRGTGVGAPTPTGWPRKWRKATFGRIQQWSIRAPVTRPCRMMCSGEAMAHQAKWRLNGAHRRWLPEASAARARMSRASDRSREAG